MNLNDYDKIFSKLLFSFLDRKEGRSETHVDAASESAAILSNEVLHDLIPLETTNE